MKFREHRGGLSDSMQTMVEVNSWEDFINHLSDVFGNRIDVSTVQIKPYSDEPDDRIGWKKTCIVLAEWSDKSVFPLGFTDSLEEEI